MERKMKRALIMGSGLDHRRQLKGKESVS